MVNDSNAIPATLGDLTTVVAIVAAEVVRACGPEHAERIAALAERLYVVGSQSSELRTAAALVMISAALERQLDAGAAQQDDTHSRSRPAAI